MNTIEDILGRSKSHRLDKYMILRKNDSLSEGLLRSEATNVIHFLLRNTIGHFEPHCSDRKFPSHNVMETYYKNLTVLKIYEHMEVLIEKMRTDQNISSVVRC